MRERERKSFALKKRKIPSTFFLKVHGKRKALGCKNKILKKCIFKSTSTQHISVSYLEVEKVQWVQV